MTWTRPSSLRNPRIVSKPFTILVLATFESELMAVNLFKISTMRGFGAIGAKTNAVNSTNANASTDTNFICAIIAGAKTNAGNSTTEARARGGVTNRGF